MEKKLEGGRQGDRGALTGMGGKRAEWGKGVKVMGLGERGDWDRMGGVQL